MSWDALKVESLSLLAAFWNQAKESGLLTAAVGSLAGALAGALGAQRIAERSKGRDELLKEIRNTNAAIMVTFRICNSLLSLKKQHVRALKETYDTQKAAILDHLGKVQRHEPHGIFEFNADFRTLSLPPPGVDILQGLIFEKLSLTGRALALVPTLRDTVHGLSATLEQRNQLIETLKANPPDEPTLMNLYFGFGRGGRVNEEYPAYIEAIYGQTDDGIFFSKCLCEDLVEYGNELAKRFRKRFGRQTPKVNQPVWDKAGDLMPKPENYADWVSMFVKQPTSQKRGWLARWRKAGQPKPGGPSTA